MTSNDPDESPEYRTPVPSVNQIISEGREDQHRLVTGTRENLLVWFRQGDRLRLLKSHHGLLGDALIRVANQMRLDRSTAYQLVRLSPEKAAEILAKCDETAAADPTFTYPGINKVFEIARVSMTRVKFQGPDEHPTPWALVNYFAPADGFDLDPAATPENAKAQRFFTKEQDGLSQKWEGNIWLNCPYANINEWLRRSYETAWSGAGTVTALLPVRTETEWFAKYATRSEITFLTGRINFEGSVGKAPFASMVCRFTSKSKRNGAKLDVRIMPTPT